MPTQAKDVMSSPAIVLREDASLEAAARLRFERRIGGVPVVDTQGLLVGFVTNSDFTEKEPGVPFSFARAPQVLGEWVGRESVERIYDAARSRRVSEVMHKPVVTVDEDASIEIILKKFLKNDITRVVVARAGVPLGIVARHDMLRLMLDGPGQR